MLNQTVQKRSVGKHACESCRKSKTRCLVDTLEQHDKCRKCLRLAIPCEWKAISQTRVRRRTDARVAVLEDQLRSLTAKFETLDAKSLTDGASDLGGPNSGRGSEAGAEQNQNSAFTGQHGATALSEPLQALQKEPVSESSRQRKGNMTLPMYHFDGQRRAELLFTFTTKLLPLYPVTGLALRSLPELEERRPYALNAMIIAACILDEPTNFRDLHEASLSNLVHAAVVSGQKSLDIIQALLITATWTDGPDDLSKLNIFQWTHLAYCMALELNLVGKSIEQNENEIPAVPFRGRYERLHTLLALGLCCSRIDISYRRQSFINLDGLVADALDTFESHATDAVDCRLVAWLRLQLIAEDIESLKQDSDLSSIPDTLSLNQTAISALEGRLYAWDQTYGQYVLDVSLKIEVDFCKSNVHGLALQTSEDHRLTVSELATRCDKLPADTRTPLSPLYVRALLAFVQDCHGILDNIMASDITTLRALPLLSGLRMLYTFKSLSMLEKRAENSNDKVGQVIDREVLKWPHYAKTVSRLLEEACSEGRYVGPSLVLRIRDRAADRSRLHYESQGSGQYSRNEPKDDESIEAIADSISDLMQFDWFDLDLSLGDWDSPAFREEDYFDFNTGQDIFAGHT